jgi:hypothetical protein
MAATITRKRGRSRRPDVLQKPRGVIHPRVQEIGPEHFGIVAVDAAKARSKWMLSDFWGNVLLPPTIVEHNRVGFDAAVAALKQALKQHDVRDLLVAVERTGRYHHAPARAFAAARLEVRTVHPLITRHFRQLADPVSGLFLDLTNNAAARDPIGTCKEGLQKVRTGKGVRNLFWTRERCQEPFLDPRPKLSALRQLPAGGDVN